MFFFVLSGYLITYLLLAERRESGGIRVRDFYVRRTLRIWPLYYGVVLVACFVFPHVPGLYNETWRATTQQGFDQKVLLYLVMLPNFAGPIAYIDHLWSIGVEEQFYLTWPVLNKLVRRTIPLCVGVIALYLLVWIALDQAGSRWRGVWNLLRIDCMAIGGIYAAVLFHRRERILAFLYARATQVGGALALVAIYWAQLELPPITYDLYAILFGLLIVNVSSNQRSLLKLEGRVVDYLGRISYGVYVYHPLAIVGALYGTGALVGGLVSDNAFLVLLYLLSLALTIGLASLSYALYESPFLRLKKRFSRIVSGDQARP